MKKEENKQTRQKIQGGRRTQKRAEGADKFGKYGKWSRKKEKRSREDFDGTG